MTGRHRRRYILKYDHHHDGGTGRYGTYDNETRTVHWCATHAEAASQLARLHALEDLSRSLNRAVASITTICTGTISRHRRDKYRVLRGFLREVAAVLPGARELEDEASREAEDDRLAREYATSGSQAAGTKT